MSPLPTVNQLKGFEDVLVQWYRENVNKLIPRFKGMAVRDEIRSTIHLVLAEIFNEYRDGKPAPDNLGGMVHVRVRHKLIDIIREDVRKGVGLPSPGRSGLPEGEIPGEDPDSSAAWAELNSPTDNPEEWAARRELVRKIFGRLAPKWHKVAKMMLQGYSPREIGDKFEQDPYPLIRHTEHLICRIRTDLLIPGTG
jgi:hypothetical protein